MADQVGLETVIQNVKEPIFTVDVDGNISFVSSRFLGITELDRAELIGADCSRIEPFVDEGFPSLREAIDAVGRGASDSERIELSMNHPETAPVPQQLPAEARVTPLIEDGARIGAIVVLRDISRRKERERELKRQNERLDNFTSVVSHDLRNPLNVAKGRLDLVRLETESDNLETVAQALERMETLIEDMLTLARSGETVGETEAVELADLLDDCWQNVETAEATLVVESDLTLEANSTRLKQLLENLFRNAVEHGSDDVTLTIGDLSGGFYVEDDGPGIPPSEREQVLQPGYTTTETGTGFGLSIVRDIAEAHDWALEITSGSDGGARFEFTRVARV